MLKLMLSSIQHDGVLIFLCVFFFDHFYIITHHKLDLYGQKNSVWPASKTLTLTETKI